MTKKLGTTKLSPQKQREVDSIKVLSEILPSRRIDTTRIWGGNYANYDGRFELINEKREYTGLKFDVQIKAISRANVKKPRLNCTTKFLRHCENSNTPVFLIGVDVDNKILYWEHLSSTFVKNLKIKRGQRSKVVFFNQDKSVKSGERDFAYLEAWESTCKKYKDDSEVKQQLEIHQKKIEVNKYTESAMEGLLYRLSKSIGRKNFDEILNDFSFLESLIYFKVDNDYPVADFIIDLQGRFGLSFGNQVVYKTPFGDLAGKSEKDLLSKYVELLGKIRYIKPKEVFNLFVKLYRAADKDIKEKIKKSIEQLAKYNLFVLQKIGYFAQENILQVIEKWGLGTKAENVDIIVLVAHELLKPSYEDYSMKDYRTLTFTTGALNPTKNLIKIRKRTIGLLIKLYNSLKGTREKILTLQALAEASYQPSQGLYGDDVISMIETDIEDFIAFYKKEIKKSEAAVLQEIERQLVWFTRLVKFKIPQGKRLLRIIRKDRFYSLYRLLVGEKYDYLDEEDFSKIDEKGNRGIENVLSSITRQRISHWLKDFNSIAKDVEIKDDSEFERFRMLLEKLATTKFEIAYEILSQSIKDRAPLLRFASSFLRGFRNAGKRDFLKRSVNQILGLKSLKILKSIPTSLIGLENRKIKLDDVKLLCDIANHTRKFNFLDRQQDKNEIRILHCLTMRGLMWAYHSNKGIVRKAVKNMLSRDKDLRPVYLNELSTALHANRIDFKEWTKKELESIVQMLVEVGDLDYRLQEILIKITKGNIKSIIALFLRRIKFGEKIEKKERFASKYNPIPHHYDKHLLKTIKSSPDYPEVIRMLFDEVRKDKKGGAYSWKVGQLVEKITQFDDTLNAVLLDAVKTGNKDDFIAALRILNHFHRGQRALNICLAIVTRTQDKKVWRKCIDVISKMGLVSGEHGFSEAYRRRLEESRSIVPNNKKQKKFLEELQDYLEKASIRHREIEDREIEEMKKEFEMGK